MPTKSERQLRDERARRLQLDERTCSMICPVSAALLGVCLTGISVLRVVTAVHGRGSLADDLLSFDALLFLVATLASYVAIREQSTKRLHWLERVADHCFILAMIVLTGACFAITYLVSA